MSFEMSKLPIHVMPQKKYIEIGGINTCYYDSETGDETILLIYGGNFGGADSASSCYAWNLNFGPLSKNFRVVALDKLGQGYTSPPLRDQDYTMGCVVAHIRDFVQAKALPPVHIVGHSRGGFIATRIATEYPELVKSLTIISSGTLSPGVGTNEVALAKPPFPPFSRESARWVYEQYCFKPETVTEDWIDAVMDVLELPSYRQGVHKFINEQLGMSLFLPDLKRYKRQTLTWLNEGRLQRPTQIVFGMNDKTVLIERGMKLFEMISAHDRRVTFGVFNESGHFLYREHSERFNSLLTSFVYLYGG